MDLTRLRILGSGYVGLFGVCNDSLCFLPTQVDKKTEETISNVLGVKTVKINIYGSALLAVFAKMNNKHIYLPRLLSEKEVEEIEKEIKVKILPTESAIGNLIEVNDNGAIISKTLDKRIAEEMRKTGLRVEQLNIAKTDIVGSALLATNNAFVVHPAISKEEAKKLEEIFGVKGGSATANSGDPFIRNSILANKKGIIMGENTTPFEINKIEEALEAK
jgi:translation initiation factor 6